MGKYFPIVSCRECDVDCYILTYNDERIIYKCPRCLKTEERKNNVIVDEDDEVLYMIAVQRWGMPAQFDMVVEECAELIKAVQKYKRHPDDERVGDIIDEITDVRIMIEQIIVMLRIDKARLDSKRNDKLRRLKEMLEDGE